MAATPSFDERERYVRELAAFVEIPSVSLDPEHRGDMRRAAEWVAGQLAFAGGRVVETFVIVTCIVVAAEPAPMRRN